ncbi:hypothetical protein PVAP13_1NG215838 [Panicum virgatum]|uniref:Uncharacterized protein n=1 Tax=Panicum virgatum TaxID=38727 RepID=A0A8T0X116_PANVG|nr:hypothetical protein PVAP13_1NG215838 [Panicum virgatum]
MASKAARRRHRTALTLAQRTGQLQKGCSLLDVPATASSSMSMASKAAWQAASTNGAGGWLSTGSAWRVPLRPASSAGRPAATIGAGGSVRAAASAASTVKLGARQR